jgi:hypothetical protein
VNVSTAAPSARSKNYGPTLTKRERVVNTTRLPVVRDSCSRDFRFLSVTEMDDIADVDRAWRMTIEKLEGG